MPEIYCRTSLLYNGPNVVKGTKKTDSLSQEMRWPSPSLTDCRVGEDICFRYTSTYVFKFIQIGFIRREYTLYIYII